jgi:MerR family transcriptional regulator, heat shock protein HspR
MGVGRLDDEDYPAVAMGQAAELLEVQPAFLRSLDAAGVLKPQRSGGGHRRYSRRQLVLAARMRALFDEGLNLEAAARIVALQDELDTARERIAELEHQLVRTTGERGEASPQTGPTDPARTDNGDPRPLAVTHAPTRRVARSNPASRPVRPCELPPE